MNDGWIPLKSIPLTGTTLTLEEHPLWQALLEEFAPCRIATPIKAEVTILPQEDGILFQGSFQSDIIMSCPRCAEDSRIHVQEHFDTFEPYPIEPSLVTATGKPGTDKRPPRKTAEPILELTEADAPDAAIVRFTPLGRGVDINPAALVWEEFSLAIPIAALCKKNCKGLCPVCGGNKNTEPCSCATGEGDPRLAALRGLTIVK